MLDLKHELSAKQWVKPSVLSAGLAGDARRSLLRKYRWVWLVKATCMRFMYAVNVAILAVSHKVLIMLCTTEGSALLEEKVLSQNIVFNLFKVSIPLKRTLCFLICCFGSLCIATIRSPSPLPRRVDWFGTCAWRKSCYTVAAPCSPCLQAGPPTRPTSRRFWLRIWKLSCRLPSRTCLRYRPTR